MNNPLRDALEWYRDEAEALGRHLPTGAHTDAVLASLTVLSIDGGARARAALVAPTAAAPVLLAEEVSTSPEGQPVAWVTTCPYCVRELHLIAKPKPEPVRAPKGESHG